VSPNTEGGIIVSKLRICSNKTNYFVEFEVLYEITNQVFLVYDYSISSNLNIICFELSTFLTINA